MTKNREVVEVVVDDNVKALPTAKKEKLMGEYLTLSGIVELRFGLKCGYTFDYEFGYDLNNNAWVYEPISFKAKMLTKDVNEILNNKKVMSIIRNSGLNVKKIR